MKIWSLVATLALVGSLAHAQSLGEVAKREHERREKNKQQGAQTEAKVIHDEDLAAAPGKAAKGTFNPASGFTRGSGGAGTGGPSSPVAAAPLPSPSPSGSGGSGSEVDTLRSGARQRLESSYERIAANAFSFLESLQVFLDCRKAVYRQCSVQAARVNVLALSIANDMEQAEDAARQGWLTPGEVRDARLRYGVEDSYWDSLVRAVRHYAR